MYFIRASKSRYMLRPPIRVSSSHELIHHLSIPSCVPYRAVPFQAEDHPHGPLQHSLLPLLTLHPPESSDSGPRELRIPMIARRIPPVTFQELLS
jgi:hypothetical protein